MTDEQAAHDLFYELKPECQAHSDGCKGCAEAIQMIAALLARRALEEAKWWRQQSHEGAICSPQDCEQCARIAALGQAAASKAAGGGQ